MIQPGAHTPSDADQVVQGEPSAAAGGVNAVVNSLSIAAGEMGVVRATKALLSVNKKDGFDCQSCAWPNPDGDRHVAEFCENGAKAVADEATRVRAGRDFFAAHAVADLAGRPDHWLGKQGRLVEPMALRAGDTHYRPISWEDAFGVVADELRRLPSPHAASFYTSGRTSNEAAFLYQLFVRAFGTNNLPDCSNMCHESSGAALGQAIGIGKGCVTLADFEKADAIFIVGQNPGTNHPRMLTTLQAAKRRGVRIVSINPLPEVALEHFKNPQDLKNPLRVPGLLFGPGTQLADLWLPVRINGDMAVFKGLMKELLEAEARAPGTVLDRAFIEGHTEGFDALRTHLDKVGWADIEEASGLSRDQLGEAARIALGSRATIVCWAMGLTQHRNAVGTIQDIVNFLLMRGDIGKPGAGPCPVRGHSNVQGDRTMGIWERPTPAFLDALGREIGFSPPREHGLDVVDTLKAMHSGSVSVLACLGGNLLSAAPDTDFTAAALRRCSLTVQVSTKLNRSHLVTGRTALILPCLGRSERHETGAGEQFVTVEDSMGIVSASRGSLRPASGELRSETAIIAGIAARVLGNQPVEWAALAADHDRIRDLISRVIPGFERFNERVRQGPFYLPNGPRDGRRFATSSGRARFTVHALETLKPGPDRFLMMTIRTHDQFNTTVYGLDDRYRGIYNGRRVIFMNPEDMERIGVMQGQKVDLASHFGDEVREARGFMVAPYRIPRGCTATYFPEANVLVPVGDVALVSNTPVSKSVVISIRPAAAC
jgi:molybdopterin-dependent oxidoreductase alpha subunit